MGILTLDEELKNDMLKQEDNFIKIDVKDTGIGI
jgi:hypothetical protein